LMTIMSHANNNTPFDFFIDFSLILLAPSRSYTGQTG